jgi:hypothetical protein
MSAQVDLDEIMKNIYGASETKIEGGRPRIIPKHGTIKYVGGFTSKRSIESAMEYQFSRNKQNGMRNKDVRAKKSEPVAAESPLVPSLDYIEQDDLNLFKKEFFLSFRMSHSYPGAIFIVPAHDTLLKMIEEMHKLLKDNNIEPGTWNAAKFLGSQDDIEYKRYILTTYGDGNNNDMPYRIDESYPPTEFKQVRRTNLMSEVYYISFKDESHVTISPFVSKKDSNTLTLIGKAAKSNYAFQGNLPKAVETNVITKKEIVSLTGGNAPRTRGECFLELVHTNGNVENAAEEFVACSALSEISDMKNSSNVESVAKKYSNFYSGDFVHTAFQILGANSEPIKMNFSNKDKSRIHKEILKNYTQKNLEFPTQSNELFSKLLKHSYVGAGKPILDSTKLFVNGLKSQYNKLKLSNNVMIADIALSMYRENDNIRSLPAILQVIDEIKSPQSDSPLEVELISKLKNSDNKRVTVKTSMLVNKIYNAISGTPFISSEVLTHSPMLTRARYDTPDDDDSDIFEQIYGAQDVEPTPAPAPKPVSRQKEPEVSVELDADVDSIETIVDLPDDDLLDDYA